MRFWKNSMFLVIFLAFTSISTQSLAQAVLPDTIRDCASARVWLKRNWYDGKYRQLGYNSARGKMYGYIDNVNDSLECVYGGYRQFHRRGNEATSILPINAEHTVPQSFFNQSEPMRGDIFHLFPTYDDWNAERANYPFAEIADPLTTNWTRNTTATSVIPTVAINEYSEFNIRNSTYEPREIQKGNTARAIFYFFVVYPTQAGDITRLGSLNTLLQWHEQDLPDAKEIARNVSIEQYQGNRNFFIDNPSWVRRAWFCTTPVVENAEAVNYLTLSPNPARNELNLRFFSEKEFTSKILIYNNLGQVVYSENASIYSGDQTLSLPIETLENGIYILRIQDENGPVSTKKFVKQ
jgi:hypothetical protein